jgi:flagellar M-ring protein FliF
MYKPNSPPEPQAIRSQQTQEATSPAGANAQGVPGALSNQPPGATPAPITANANAPAGANGQQPGAGQNGQAGQQGAGPARHDATTNYELDKTVRYEQKPMGGIKRLTVGVVVNYRRTVDPKTGKVTVSALPAAVVAQINELVKQAMGYSAARGDTLNVTNAPFDGVDKPAEKVATPDWYRDPSNLPLAIQAGKYALSIAIIAFLYFRILRPLVRRALAKFDSIAEAPPGPDLDEEERKQDLIEAEIAQAQGVQRAHGYRANLQMAKELARDDPRIVANVIKTWVDTE